MAQQAAQIDFTQPPPAIDFSQPPPLQDALIAKYKLPKGTDLNKGYFGQDEKLNIDPVKFSQAYSEMNPQAPTPQSFFGRAWDEAHQIVNGLMANPEGVAGFQPPNIQGAIEGVQSRAKEAKEHPAAAAGAATTDLISMALPFVIDKLSLPSRTKLAGRLYTPEGNLKPGMNALFHPTELPEYLLKKAVPPPTDIPTTPGHVGAPFPDVSGLHAAGGDIPTSGPIGAMFPEANEFYATTGQERAKVFERELREQLKAQRQVARDAKSTPPVSPFAGATSSSAPAGQAPLPAPGAGMLSSTAGGAIPQGASTPFVSKFTPPEAPRVVTPSSPAPPINRTLVSYDAKTLVQMARSGDLDALNELIRNPRGVDINKAVPNAKYLLEANRATNIYGGPKRGTLSELTK